MSRRAGRPKSGRQTNQRAGAWIRAGAALATAFCLAAPFEARARVRNKFDLAAGAFSFQAESDKGNGSLSNLGVYRAMYHMGLLRNLQFGIGYTLFMTDIFTGDMGFGPDIGLYYYPVTDSGSIVSESPQVSLRLSEQIRPFVGASFHQRQFQSISSTYAGFGVAGGAEYDFRERIYLKGEVRYLLMSGPNRSTATQMDILAGFGFEL